MPTRSTSNHLTNQGTSLNTSFDSIETCAKHVPVQHQPSSELSHSALEKGYVS